MKEKSNWVKDFADQFKIKVKYLTKSYAGGFADSKNRTIIINRQYFKQNQPDAYSISIIFHEICHILADDHKKFHKIKRSNRIARLCGLKMERYVDKKAKEMFDSFKFNDIKYFVGYSTKTAHDWYHKNYLDKYFPKKT